MAKDTKERILSTALEMFSQKGYAGTNIRDLTASLGLVKSSMYKHFASKEEIWDTLALIKGINVVSGFVMQKRFVAVHTIMNKVTGALLFIFPLTLPLVELRYTATVVCAIATFAAIQEGHAE